MLLHSLASSVLFSFTFSSPHTAALPTFVLSCVVGSAAVGIGTVGALGNTTTRWWVIATDGTAVRERPWGKVLCNRGRGVLLRCDTEKDGWLRIEQDFTEEGPLETGHIWRDVGDKKATAVIPITLVVTSVHEPGPYVLNLQVPSYDPAKPGGEVTGHFAVDLLMRKESYFLRRSTSWVYAFSGRHRAGPVPVALLAPDDLQP